MARDAIGEATLEGSMKSFAGRKVWRGTATVDRQRFEVVSWIEPIADGQRGYLVTGLNQSSDRARPAMSQGEWLKTFESFAQSVRAMRTDEKALASPPKLRIGTTTAASTYERLAATVPLGAERLAQLRVINGQYPDGQPGVRRFKFID